MCIVAIAWRVLDNTPLFLISNRDEFYQRPTQSLDYQEDLEIFSGKDLQSGGTWLGTTKTGRWAIITNYRDGTDKRQFATSRGHLVQQFLQSELLPIRFAEQLLKNQQNYAGFNLILGNREQAVYLSNRGESPQILANGVYVLSNGLMSDNWAKTNHLRKRFTQELLPIIQQKNNIDDDILNHSFEILQDTRQPPIEQLPNTGVSLVWEQLLSSTFVKGENYGTRCSNVLMMTDDKLIWYEKQQHGENIGIYEVIEYELA